MIEPPISQKFRENLWFVVSFRIPSVTWPSRFQPGGVLCATWGVLSRLFVVCRQKLVAELNRTQLEDAIELMRDRMELFASQARNYTDRYKNLKLKHKSKIRRIRWKSRRHPLPMDGGDGVSDFYPVQHVRRPKVNLWGLGVQNKFLWGQDFSFMVYLSGHNKFWGHCPRMPPPVASGLHVRK